MKKSALAMAVAASLFSYASTSYAASDSAQTNDDTVIVTANRFEQKVSDTISPVEVITKDQIRAIQAKSFTDIIRRLPGIQVSNNGGIGQTSSVYLRGRSSKNILVMINGIRIGSATTGSADFSKIPLNGIEKIEVLRGARATIYGSDAVSGVINIITTGSAKNTASVGAGFGSDEFYELTADASVTNQNGAWLNMTATHAQTEGYNVKPSSTYAKDTDDDGDKNDYLLFDAGTDVTDAFSIKLNGYYQKDNAEYDAGGSSYTDESESELYNLGAIGEYSKDNLDSRITLATNEDSSTSKGNGQDPSEISTKRYVFSWANQYRINQSVDLIGGIDWSKDKVFNESTAYSNDHRTNLAGYIGSSIYLDRVTGEASLRIDNDSQFGNFYTYQVGVSYQLTDDLKISASNGTSFKAPTFNQLYWPKTCYSASYCYEGNADLNPEKSETNEVSLSGILNAVEWSIAGYHSDVDNMIETNSSGKNVNVGKADIKGVEVTTKFDTGSLQHEISYDYLDARDEETGKHLIRRSQHSAKWNSSYFINNWQFELSYLYQGSRYDNAANTNALDPYSLVDFAMTYHFENGVKVAGKVGNIFDTEYETARNYSTAGRKYYINMNYTF